MHVKPWHACAAAAVTLVALASSATAAEPEHDYANQTPYGKPEASIEKPPAGYRCSSSRRSAVMALAR